ncbi:hypothetical protein GCM10027258_70670 [Amycolatopsis stemonae]
MTTLPADRRSGAADSLRHFLGTPAAMQVMRALGSGVPLPAPGVRDDLELCGAGPAP